MRITTWNCCQATDARVPVMLDRLKPDIAIVPESSATPALAEGSLLRPPVPHAWTGAYPSKGLWVFAPSAAALHVLDVDGGDGAHGLAVRVDMADRSVDVLGIWTIPLAAGGLATPYLNAVDAILRRHDRLLASGEVVVGGDLNASGQVSPHAMPTYLDEVRERYGLVSAYHRFTGERVGGESRPTLWWRHKWDAPFHCDFLLVPESWTLEAVDVGGFDAWCAPDAAARSDHAPVTADLALG